MNNLTYLAQVRLLRVIAQNSLKQYPIRVKSLDFICHGENTTYKLTDTQNNKYLLRVHRLGYQSIPAIHEELNWLKRLSKTDINCQVPIANTKGKLISHVDGRNITIISWVEGRHIYKSVNKKHMQMLASLLSKMHKNTKSIKVKYRQYWDAKGLAGPKPFVGSINEVLGLNNSQQKYILESSKEIFKRLKDYEKKTPHKMGLIHGDLHFGNFFLKNSELSPIDFDDCGFGFHLYDLSVIDVFMGYFVKAKKLSKKNYQILSDELLNSYSKINPLSDHDIRIYEDLNIARRLVGTQWLNNRKDHPKLKQQIKSYSIETISLCKKHLEG
ncbi:MAG: Ser/Thr protein kinase RdoA (MazF antagonist) [Thermoproteota archaeon]|jgi:Ser/Thr protein kinase RdoA (MazF antagonist)